MQVLELAYKQYGDTGPHVVILHGLLGTLDNWQTVAKHLGNHCRVTSFDMRNHGRSPHSAQFTIKSMAADVHYMMQKLQIPAAFILGHSMGGKVAMEFALTNRQETDGLIVVDIAPKRYPRGHDDIFDALLSVDLQQYISRKEIEMVIRQTITDNGTIQFLMKNLSRDAATNQFEWKPNLPVLYQQYDEITKEIVSRDLYQGPALFLRGARSNYIKDPDIATIHSLFPDAVLQTIPDAGHWLHADQPELTIEALRVFLQKNGTL